MAVAAEDRALFRAALKGVKPIRYDRVIHEPSPFAAIPRQRLRDESRVLADSLSEPLSIELLLEGGNEPAWTANGISRNVLRDLRRGRWTIQDHLDLHGLNRYEAHDELRRFVAACSNAGRRCVRIVHGRGRGSPGREPVLKQLVRGWLARRADVLAYCQAPLRDGGEGALWVLLRGTPNSASPRR